MLTTNQDLIRVSRAYRAGIRRANPQPVDFHLYMSSAWERAGRDLPTRAAPRRNEFRGPASAARRMYSMQDQAADAPLWIVLDGATGVTLGRVRGHAVWACDQIRKLLASQGARFEDVAVLRGSEA